MKRFGESQSVVGLRAERPPTHIMKHSIQKCPNCKGLAVRVVCTKTGEDGVTVRRRRCDNCKHRWYTVQYPEAVVSKDEIKWEKAGTTASFVPS